VKTVRLTRQAEARLVDIVDWTMSNFSGEQADRYEQQLIGRLDALARGESPKGRSCALLAPGVVARDDLLYIKEGGHYIIYRESDDLIAVIDFMHGARDLAAILRELQGGDIDEAPD
jgi:plasmid stabilization system protein ParE